MWLLAPLLVLNFAWAQTSCEAGLRAFQNTIHPELVKSCSGCHGDEAEIPAHSANDILVAYQAAKPLADFYQLERSRFISKVRAKHWLRHNPNAIGMTEEKMRELLTAWYETGEKDCVNNNFTYTTSFLRTPENSDKFETMRWKMNDELVIEIDVQKYKSEADGSTSYRMRKPRVLSAKDLRIKGLGLIINGETNPLENAFLKIDQWIADIPLIENVVQPFPVLSVETLITVPRTASRPMLGIGFETLALAPGERVECKNLPAFENLQKELQVSCLTCHGNVDNVGAKRFPMNSANEELCREFTNRGQNLYDVAIKGKLEHTTITNPQALNRFKRAWSAWNL